MNDLHVNQSIRLGAQDIHRKMHHMPLSSNPLTESNTSTYIRKSQQTTAWTSDAALGAPAPFKRNRKGK